MVAAKTRKTEIGANLKNNGGGVGGNQCGIAWRQRKSKLAAARAKMAARLGIGGDRHQPFAAWRRRWQWRK
jgi:hypothetical protein